MRASYDGGNVKLTESGSKSSEFYSVKMQQPDGKKIDAGTHEFALSYVYDMSDDKVSGYDDFIFDVLGYAMNKVINFSAKITFPEGTDLSNVSFRTNNKAAWSPQWNGESVSVVGNVIEINATPNAADKGYTVQVILPEGYFDASVTFYGYYIVFVILAVAGMVVSLVLISICLPRKPLETVEFYPPEGMSVMRFSSVWHRGAKSKDAAALILKWAGQGFIEIEKDGKRDLKIRLLDVPDKNDKAAFTGKGERGYFEALFSGIGGSTEVFSTKYFKKKALTIQKQALYKAGEILKDAGDKPDPEYKKCGAIKYALPFVGLVPTLSILIYYVILMNNAVLLFFFIFMAAGTFVGSMMVNNKFNILSLIMMVVFPAMFYGFIYCAFAIAFATDAYDYIGLLIIAPVWWALNLFIAPRLLRRRSEEVQRDYGRILGFKRFLLYAELPRIQALFDDDPDYFKEILPWCLIMGISDKVQERFKALNVVAPAYIDSGIDARHIGSCMHSSHYSAASASGAGIGGGGGGGGGGHGGSSGGGGGGGGSRGC